MDARFANRRTKVGTQSTTMRTKGVIAVVALKRIISNVLNNNKNHIHNRYKVELISQDTVIQTLGVPSNRTRLHVVEIARRELRRISTATHADIRALNGRVHTVYAHDGWLTCQFKALKL